MTLILRREPDVKSHDFYLVWHAAIERPIGRLYGKTAADGHSREWFWGLGFPYTLNEPAPFYGTVGSRDEAMKCFRDCWNRTSRPANL